MKRLICMLLVVATILAAFPAVAFADGLSVDSDEVYVESTSASQEPFAGSYGPVYLVKGRTLNYSSSGVPAGTKFKSSNKNVVTVTSKGVIKGINYGKATLKVTHPDGTYDTYTIKVTKRATAGVTVYDKQRLEIRILNNYINKDISKVKVVIEAFNKKNQRIIKENWTLSMANGETIPYGYKGVWDDIWASKANVAKAKVTITRVYYSDGSSAPN